MSKKHDHKLLITGSSGFLGGHLFKMAADFGFKPIGTKSKNSSSGRLLDGLIALDLSDKDNIFSVVKKHSPSVIVHCAALSDMAFCEQNAELAYSVNALGTKYLAEAAQEIGAHFIYVSTDLVFDGVKGNYSEADIPAPTTVYGKTKYDGEKFTLGVSDKFAVARLAWCYGLSVNKAQNYLDKFLLALKNGETQNLFVDEFRSPIYVRDACFYLLSLANSKNSGIFHLAGKEKISRYDFGLKVTDAFRLDSGLIKSALREKLAPHRPKDTCLVCVREIDDKLVLHSVDDLLELLFMTTVAGE